MHNYLNLGCGNRFHKDWYNIDFQSNNVYVKPYNLLKGIPYDNNTFEVVYHSHVLEHFSKSDAEKFISECYRVLTEGGTLRIAVPDLEQIVREYIKNMELSIEGNKDAQNNYEWIMLELYDQTVRNHSGGDMANYLFQDVIDNEDYVFQRIGEEGRSIRNNYLLKKRNRSNRIKKVVSNYNLPYILKLLYSKLKFFIKNLVISPHDKECIKIGRFRLGGEIHQWMYDRYSLKLLLEKYNFKNIEVKTAFDSNIREWNKFELDTKDGVIYKPDSLFIEAKK